MAEPDAKPNPPTELDPLAGLLSYLLPGLGQIVRGRVAKGVLFLVSLHVLFFFGMYLGSWKNVYLPSNAGPNDGFLNSVASDLYDRPHFAGQFWIGLAAWPAVYQYHAYTPNPDPAPVIDRFQQQPEREDINELQRNNDKTWDLGWVYTVIAGVLNLLVIYDAVAGPAYRADPDKKSENDADGEKDKQKPQ